MSAILLSFLLQAAAAEPAQAARPIFTSDGAFLASSVPDVEASARWYQDKLGLSIVMQPPEQGGSRMIALEGGGLLVELIQNDTAKPLRQAAPGVQRDYEIHGIFKAGVMVEDWDRLLAELKARNVPIAIGPFPASAEQRANLLIRDHDGNFIQFFGDYARR